MLNVRRLVGFLALVSASLCCADARLVAQGATREPVSPFVDARLKSWVAGFLRGERDAVLEAVERDLRSGAPHPSAPHVWTLIKERKGVLLEDWQKLDDPVLRTALGELPDVYISTFHVRGPHGAADLLSRFPAERTTNVRDPYVLMYLYDASVSRRRFDDAAGYLAAGLRIDQELYDIAENLGDFFASYRALAPAAFLASVKDGKTPVTGMAASAIQFDGLGDLQRLALADAWLVAHPLDADALASRGDVLTRIGRWEQALDAYSRSHASYPFTQASVDNYARALLRVGRVPEAQQLLASSGRLHARDSAAAIRWTQLHLASALRSVGERGEARKVVVSALRAWPKDHEFLVEMAQLEEESGRPAHAATYAAEAARARPEDYWIRLQQLGALHRAGKLAEARSVLNEIELAFTAKTEQFYYLGGEVLNNAGSVDAALALYRRAVDEFPNSQWMAGNLAYFIHRGGAQREALQRLTASFDFEAPDSWDVARTRQWSDSLTSGSSTRRTLAELRQRFPHSQALWEDHAAHPDAADTVAAQLAVWREAIAANPGRAWPWGKLISVLTNAKRWDEAERSAQAALNAVARASSDDRAGAWYHLARVPSQRVLAERLPAGPLEVALQHVDSLFANGGSHRSVHEIRSNILAALGRRGEAAEEFVLARRSAPDDHALAENVVIRYGSELGLGRAMRELRRHVDRNPFDGRRLRSLLHKQVMWAINPVEALRTVAMIRDRAPDSNNPEWEAMAWEKLGQAARPFTIQYGQVDRIQPSDRYVQWYERARLRAQNTALAPDSVTIDTLTRVATIVRPNGTIVKRADHVLSGKPTLRQIGNAWIRADYDSLGDRLARVWASNGREVHLSYDASARIDTIRTSQDGKLESVLRFGYNARGKPDHITLAGVGEIVVTYDGDRIVTVQSDAGRHIAQQVAAAFEKLLSLIRAFDERSEAIPDFSRADRDLDSLRARYEQASAAGADHSLQRAALSLGRYLTDHAGDRPSHAADAEALLTDVMDWSLGRSDQEAVRLGSEAGRAWYDLIRATRGGALDREGWARWTTFLAWLGRPRGPNGTPAAVGRLRQMISTQPLTLAQGARWLPRSHVNNPGFWRRYRESDMLPTEVRSRARLQSVVVRRNHDVVVGTSHGMAILRGGYWRWLAFDDARGVFSSTLPSSLIAASSDVLALTEDSVGSLWIGTANGLFRVTGAYDGPVTRWRTPSDGLPTPRVERLASSGGDVLVGTPSGLRVVRKGAVMAPSPELGTTAIAFLRPLDELASAGSSGASGVFVGTTSGVFVWNGVSIERVVDGTYADVLWDRSRTELFLLRGRQLFTSVWAGQGPARPTPALGGQQGVEASQVVFGLAPLPLDERGPGVALLTDLGMSVYRDDHFEHVDVPQLLVDRRAGVQALGSRGRRVFLLTSEGVVAIEQGQVLTDTNGRVYDLLTPARWGRTFIARGDRLEVVSHDQAEPKPRVFSYTASTRLASDAQGRVVTNDGLRILRYERGSEEPRELFVAEQTTADGWPAGAVTSILTASDGTIWVTAGPSLFRWREGASAEEFNMIVDGARFPSRSEMISRVIETVDRRIWVIASDEGHLFQQGVKLSGGVLEYDPAANLFRQMQDFRSAAADGWFMTSYTPIDSLTAIAGSSAGFALHRANRFATFRERKDVSYSEVLETRTPLLWLGTRGVHIGNGIWLFGTAGGVIGYQDGEWFFPDRLNRMLPDDQHLSQYGSRTVHAVATDPAGRVYAGTDRGLLVYNSGGGDAMSFLVTVHPDRGAAFRIAEQEKLRREADLLLSQLDPQSADAKQARQILAERQELERLRELVSPATTLQGTRQGSASSDTAGLHTSRAQGVLRQELAEKERNHARLLTQLERDNLSLFQLLQLNPLDLLAERARLRPGEATVQYLPTERTLYIQVVTRDAAPVIREVQISRDSLYARARFTALLLASPVRRSAASGSTPSGDDLHEHLAWLYEQLLRPIESDLAGQTRVFVVPAGPLSYVPFGALVRSKSPTVEYAIARHSFGYLPTMYLLSLVLQPRSGGVRDALVMGDPEGDLPRAREEAGTIHRMLRPQTGLQIGADASYEHFLRYAPSARILHLATHGVLNQERPGESYLRLAGGRRLSVADAMLLNLSGTDLAVLSACQSGLGGEGLEYATLVRAFAHAKVPSVVATLWSVEDAPSGMLMRLFYERIQRGDDLFAALRSAQRTMSTGAAGDGSFTDPRHWAGYLVFGKPATLDIAP